MKRVLILLFLFQSIGYSTTVYDTLYINQGTLAIIYDTIPTCVFNDSANFFFQNKVIELNEGDILQLHVVNNDNMDHTFTIDGFLETGNIIPASGSNDFTLNFSQIGAYRFYSDQPYGKFLGASSLIMYGYENFDRYYWNMYEQSDTLAEEIDLGMTNAIPVDYEPNIFTINMRVHPDLTTDTLSYISANVGDTIIIAIANSGNMEHCIHFHGYHVTILDASVNSGINGWIKDSFPILMGEVVLVQLIPDQEGVFPIHEHNLINVSTNGVYPGGMVNIIDIQP